MSRSYLVIVCALLACWTTGAGALTAADKCEADKLKRAGKYNFCRLKAESKAIKTASSPDYTLCDSNLSQKWTNAELVGGGQCPTNGDLGPMLTRITTDANDIVACLNGTCPPSCGDGTANGAESCDGIDLDGESCATLGFASGTLTCTAGCGFDVSACVPVPPSGSCGDNVVNGADSCDGIDLDGESCVMLGFASGTLTCTAGCGFDVSACVPPSSSSGLPATGQTTTYGTGSDGDVQAGAPLAYTDNGDGTVTDTNTGLMWEKKSDDGSIHDWNNTYSWGMTSSPYTMNGTMVTTFRDTLNDVAGGGASCFAGHCDWRIPNRNELRSIVNSETFSPAVSAAFNTACAPTCTVLTCSCTFSSPYWSSTTFAPNPIYAWLEFFASGNVIADTKGTGYHVRAVRGG